MFTSKIVNRILRKKSQMTIGALRMLTNRRTICVLGRRTRRQSISSEFRNRIIYSMRWQTNDELTLVTIDATNYGEFKENLLFLTSKCITEMENGAVAALALVVFLVVKNFIHRIIYWIMGNWNVRLSLSLSTTLNSIKKEKKNMQQQKCELPFHAAGDILHL